MPHRASLLMSTNTKTGDPGYLAERQSAIGSASSITSLITALELDDDEERMAAAADADTFLPGAVVQAIVAAYRAAAATGTDGVHINWNRSGGYSVTVAHAPGTHAVTDRGVVSVTVKSPNIGS